MIAAPTAGFVSRRGHLLRWGATHGRTFPWRFADPFPLAVAEILLQKTHGSAVQPVWERLISRYPAPEALSRARPFSVERIVTSLGLGKQRIQRLQQMAKRWDRDGSDSLPGLGPYGSGIVAIAGGREHRAAPVDGNIARVITRVHGWSFERGESRKKPEVRQGVDDVLARTARGDRLALVYSLVDLGALMCTPRSPRCSGCPLEPRCQYAAVPKLEVID